MAITPWKALLFASGGTVAVVGTAYISGALDPFFKKEPPGQVETVTPPPVPKAETQPPAAATPPADAAQPAPKAETPAPATEAATPPADASQPAPKTDAAAAPATNPPADQAPAPTPPAVAAAIVPTFDVVRVESDGSVVIAGHAGPKFKVDVLNGDTVIGSTTAEDSGDFAIVLDDPLKPGDYQLTLRATGPGNAVVASAQTAVVSIPEKVGGQVLAMVEEPGKPADIITVPQPEKPAAPPATGNAAATPPASDNAATPPAVAKTEPAPAPAEAKTEPATSPAEAKIEPAPAQPATPVTAAPAAGPKVVVEAVEIDGGKIFVAGLADPGRKVRAYANDLLLGDAVTSPDGHFLVESTHDLAVGEYTVRVDALGADGAKVVARATVPFQREPGESIAAVAPEQPKPVAPAEQPAVIAADDAAKPAALAPAADAAAAPAKTETQPATAAAPAVPAAQPTATAEAPVAPANQQPAAVAAAPPPDDGVPSTTAPKLQATTGAVIIRRRDTLWHISRQVYGHGTRYSTIYLANQDQISDPDKIWPGQVFKVPEKSTEGEPANLEILGKQATTVPAKTK